MKIPHLRWWIVALIFGASVLNYIDRQTLSVLAPTIQKDLKLSNEDYASVLNLFLIAYTTASLLSGKVVDKLGVRVSLALFVGWWSVANILTGFARSVGSLGAFRFLLGLGEAGNWTAAPKAVADWFPARERGIAIGIYTLGATVGATIAPILIVGLATWHSWQAAFVVTGLAGLLWLIPWLWLYRRPEEHPRLTDAERTLILSDTSTETNPGNAVAGWGKWWQVFGRHEVWLLIFGRMLTDPVWYFFQFWFAKYLYDGRGLDQKQLTVTWVVYLAADIGVLGGGLLSGLLIKRKVAPAKSRLWVMLGCALLVPVAAAIPHLGSLWLVLAVGMIAVLAHMAWLINLSALVVDLVPKGSLGFTFGVVATGSSLGGMMMNKAVGGLVTHLSYDPAFHFMLLLHPLAWLLLWQLRPRPAA
ncbi:MFS transporter [Horticoccus sp. 23ND18S-11]|uniref:MFS transporter n=1 Tax=Horticoccus sp. 23ND18S-11 TaxID=3391832 RepID=UPI0039C8FDF1